MAYCDGDWAVSANAPAYLNQPFMHREHGWVVFTADSSSPGVGHECYTGGYLDQIGAPEVVRQNLVTCDVSGSDPDPGQDPTLTVPVTPAPTATATVTPQG